MTEIVVSRFCQKDLKVGIIKHNYSYTQSGNDSMQLFSYALDVVFPKLLLQIIMDMFNVNSEEVWYVTSYFAHYIIPT